MSFLNTFIGSIKQRQAEVGESLVAGHVVNFETYQRLVGQHQGLQEALDILNRMLEEKEADVDQ
jgi:hypothetical protein